MTYNINETIMRGLHLVKMGYPPTEAIEMAVRNSPKRLSAAERERVEEGVYDRETRAKHYENTKTIKVLRNSSKKIEDSSSV